jgi:hypothetical protein
MPFTAECFFCHVLIRNVPDRQRGLSKKCPRCRNSFTWAETSRAQSKSGSRTEHRLLQTAEAHTDGNVSTKSTLLESSTQEELAPPSRELVPVTQEPQADEALSLSPCHDQADPPREAIPELRAFTGSTFRRSKRKSYAGWLCFCFASCAFMTLSMSGAVWFALPLALVALAIGSVSLIRAPSWSRSDLAAFPGLAVALGVLAMLALSSRDFLFRGKTREGSSPAAGPSSLVHLNAAGVTHRVEPKEEAWVDASADAAQFGYVRVRVAAVTLEVPGPAKSTARSAPAEKRLVIKLRVSNTGATQVLHYKGWNAEKTGLQLRDDQGREIRFKAVAKRGSGKFVARADIPPEKWIDDELVFEPPSSLKNALQLELPGSAIGREDKLQFRIPSGMIQQSMSKSLAN